MSSHSISSVQNNFPFANFTESVVLHDSSWSFPFPLYGSSSPALSTHPQQGTSNILHSINIQAVSETPQWAGNVYWCTSFPVHLCFIMCCWVQEARTHGVFEHRARMALCCNSGKNFWGLWGRSQIKGAENCWEAMSERSPRRSLLQSDLTSDFSLLQVLITVKRIQQRIPLTSHPYLMSSRGLMASPFVSQRIQPLRDISVECGWDLPKVSASEINLESGKKEERWREGKNLVAMNWDIRLMERQDPPPDSWLGKGSQKMPRILFLWPE